MTLTDLRQWSIPSLKDPPVRVLRLGPLHADAHRRRYGCPCPRCRLSNPFSQPGGAEAPPAQRRRRTAPTPVRDSYAFEDRLSHPLQTIASSVLEFEAPILWPSPESSVAIPQQPHATSLPPSGDTTSSHYRSSTPTIAVPSKTRQDHEDEEYDAQGEPIIPHFNLEDWREVLDAAVAVLCRELYGHGLPVNYPTYMFSVTFQTASTVAQAAPIFFGLLVSMMKDPATRRNYSTEEIKLSAEVHVGDLICCTRSFRSFSL